MASLGLLGAQPDPQQGCRRPAKSRPVRDPLPVLAWKDALCPGLRPGHPRLQAARRRATQTRVPDPERNAVFDSDAKYCEALFRVIIRT